MRVMKLQASLPSKLGLGLLDSADKARLCVKVAEKRLSASSLHHILDSKDGLVAPVWVNLPPDGPEKDRIALRRFLLRGCEKADPVAVEVEEELGESIARHVWDAGVMAVAFLADICSADPSAARRHCMQITRDILRKREPLGILELGSGVGILGLGLISVLASVAGRPGMRMSMMLTDLPDAESRALSNISRFAALQTRQTSMPTAQIEYANLDWEDGRNGLLAPEVQSRPWNLVVLSDCTYNVDMLPALVQTLSALHSCAINRHEATGLRVLLATKPRHASEKALFALMGQDGWKILESVTLPLPVLDAESESVEIYLFGKG